MSAHTPGESSTPTPYAVFCRGDAWEGGPCNGGALIYINQAAYEAELMSPDSLWKCPRCHGNADWCDATRPTPPTKPTRRGATPRAGDEAASPAEGLETQVEATEAAP